MLVTVPHELAEYMRSEADAQGISRSYWVSNLLTECLGFSSSGVFFPHTNPLSATTNTVHVSLDRQITAALNEACMACDLPKNLVIRQALRKYLHIDNEGNQTDAS